MKFWLAFLVFAFGFFCFSVVASKKCEECQTIRGKLHLPTGFNHKDLRHQQEWRNMQVILNSGKFVGYPNSDGLFEFHNIPPGKYLLEVNSIIFHYDRVMLDVPAYHPKYQFNLEAHIWNPYSSKKIKTAYPLELRSEHLYQYFEKVEEMTIGSIVKNQYFFMIALTVVMLVFVKKMPNMEELQQQMQQENESIQQQPSQK